MRLAGMLRRLAIATTAALTAGCGGDGSGITDPRNPPTPTSIRLESDAGDYIGQGRSYAYDQASAQIQVTASGGHLSIRVRGDENWSGDFQLPAGRTRIETGTYGDVTRYPFHDAAAGGLSWSGEGRGCNALGGSFTIEDVTYAGGQLTGVELRFEQRCEGRSVALRGKIHWSAGDTTAPPGPVNPPPASLWRPDTGATPATGNFVYFKSDPGDYIGGGQTWRYVGSAVSVYAGEGRLSVSVAADEWWRGDFQVMSTLTRLQPGYYPNLARYPVHNPVKGGLSWSGAGRGCNTLTGWFVIDRVTYSAGRLTAVELRFEQHCEGGGPALRGAIRWTA